MTMRSVLITGASRGIGLELVRQLCRRECAPEYVFATCRNPDKSKDLQALAKDCKNIEIIQIDVRKEETYGPALEKVSASVGEGGLNVLINNAGIFTNHPYDAVSREYLTDVMDINIISPMRLTQFFLPLLKQAAESSPVKNHSIERTAVVNISSGYASIAGNSSGVAAGYRESKAALNMFSKSLSLSLAKEKILALSLDPGWVQTEMGGPNASRTVEEAVSSMLTILSQTDENHNGLFLANQVPIRIMDF